MEEIKEKGWNLALGFKNKEEGESFIKWWGKRYVFGVRQIRGLKLTSTDFTWYFVTFEGGSGSRLILEDIFKEIKKKFPNVDGKIVQANN